MNTLSLNGRWDAAAFFEDILKKNILAQKYNFVFCNVSGLEGFEDALTRMQEADAFLCVSDSSDGYISIDSSTRASRVKTVFLALRHEIENMEARRKALDVINELFRQLVSRLIQQKTILEQKYIYISPRINFNEIESYFASGCACAFFNIGVEIFTDFQLRAEEWSDYYGCDKC